MFTMKNVLAAGAVAAFALVAPATVSADVFSTDTVAAAHHIASADRPGLGNGISLGGTNAGGGGSNRNN
ncbi:MULTISPECIES: hypothetical protein [Nonomuraea]|uniref:Secreted protein n=1 Tax=Nonomuraea mangrovi TaxID=2316207 RepID=A0ABW4T6E7_9ACTN